MKKFSADEKKAAGVGMWAVALGVVLLMAFGLWLLLTPRDANVRSTGTPPALTGSSAESGGAAPTRPSTTSGNTGQSRGGVPTPPVTMENTPDPTVPRGHGGATSDSTRGTSGPVNPSEAVR